MIHYCSCGFVADLPSKAEQCPACKRAFEASCLHCRSVHPASAVGRECLCAGIVVAGFGAAAAYACQRCSAPSISSELGKACTAQIKDENGEAAACGALVCIIPAELDRKPSQPVFDNAGPVSRLFPPPKKGKSSESGSTVSIHVEQVDENPLDAQRRAIDRRLRAVLETVKDLKERLFREGINNVRVEPHLTTLRGAYDDFLRILTDLTAFLTENAIPLRARVKGLVEAKVAADMGAWQSGAAAAMVKKNTLSEVNLGIAMLSFGAAADRVGASVATHLVDGLLRATHVLRILETPLPVRRFGTTMLRPSMSAAEMKQTIALAAPEWLDLLRAVRGPIGLQYLISLQNLMGNIPESLADRARFLGVLDPNTRGLTAPAYPTDREISLMRVQTLAVPVVSKAIKAEGAALMIDYWATLVLLDEVCDALSQIRIRFLGGDARGSYIVQRSLQSGDSNGVAFALISFPEWSLLYIFPPEDVGAARSTLQYYAALGVDPARIRISVAWNNERQPDLAEQTAIEDQLNGFTRRPIDMVCYGAGANGLYSQLVNQNYITREEDKIYLDAIYQLAMNRYQPVGHSTDLLFREASKESDLDADAKIGSRIINALDANVKPDDKAAIANFVKGFSQAIKPRFKAKAGLTERVVVSSTRSFQMDLHLTEKSQRRPELGRSLVLLFWVRGPQGTEAQEMQYMSSRGMYSATPTSGKPWHHSTMQLLATIRAMGQEMANTYGVPVYFVPIGDVPEDAYKKIRFYPLGEVDVATLSFSEPEDAGGKSKPKAKAKPKAPDSASAEPKGGQSSSDDAHGKWEHIPEWLRDGGAELMTPGGILAPDCTRLSCLAQQAPSCGQRAAFNAMAMKASRAGDAQTLAALANDGGLRALGGLVQNVGDEAVRAMLAGHDDIAIVTAFDRVRRFRDDAEYAFEDGDQALLDFATGDSNYAVLVVNTLAIDYPAEPLGPSGELASSWPQASTASLPVEGSKPIIVADSGDLSVSTSSPPPVVKETVVQQASPEQLEPSMPPSLPTEPVDTGSKPEIPSLPGSGASSLSLTSDPPPTEKAGVSSLSLTSDAPQSEVAVVTGEDGGKQASASPEVAVRPPEVPREPGSLRVEAFVPKYSKMNDTLVEYFKRLPAFSNRNRFNQLYFFRELMRCPKLRVIQVGLRSGAIEQGMYLGIPTVYIDIATPAIQRFRSEDDTTRRMWRMTSTEPYKTFKKFRCLFSENVIGVFNRIVGAEQTIAVHRMVRKALVDYPRGTRALSSQQIEKPMAKEGARKGAIDVPARVWTKGPGEQGGVSQDETNGVADQNRGFWEGTLRPIEVRELFDMITDLYYDYPDQIRRVAAARDPVPEPKPEPKSEPGSETVTLSEGASKPSETSASPPVLVPEGGTSSMSLTALDAPTEKKLETGESPVLIPIPKEGAATVLTPSKKNDRRVGHYIAVQLVRHEGRIVVHFADSLAAGASRLPLIQALLAAMRL